MKQLASVSALAAFFCFLFTNLSAQNILITSQNPDGLYVCGEDTVRMTLNNTASGAISNIITTLTLPNGIQYVPGSVTGATEQNISDLGAPKFSIASLGQGTNQTISVRVLANCDLVAAINSGQLFNNIVSATYTGGSDQITTLNYPVETGLAVIVSATPFLVVGEKGQMPQREIVVKNTRLGPIHRLIFTDQHFPGFTGIAPGAVLEDNSSPVFFRAEFDASFFNGFGDGDGIFEFNEEVKIIEKLMITDCGTPSFDNPSIIRVGWGCNADVCQYDSTNLELTILPSTQNPALRFEPIFGFPTNYCAGVPATNQVLIINDGEVAAENVFMDFYNGFLDFFTGMDENSFEYNAGAGWVSLPAQLTSPISLDACEVTYSSRVAVTVPLVPAKDTVVLRYNYFECYPDCLKDLIPPYLFTFYEKPCPEGATATDSIGFVIDSTLLDVSHLVRFNFPGCIDEGETYPFLFTAKSPRFLFDTTFYQIRLNLPKGITWDSTCTLPPVMDGKTPVFTSQEPSVSGGTIMVLAFKLPFSADSVAMPFCLKFICEDSLGCENMDGAITQGGGMSTVYPQPPNCPGYCGLPTKTQGSIVNQPDEAEGCGLSSCHNFKLHVNATCPDSGGGGDGGGGGGGLFSGAPNEAQIEYETYRTNYGLKDDNDDRMADDNTTLAPFEQIRHDRYIPADTLRFHLKALVLEGTFGDVSQRIITESLASDFGVADGDNFQLPLATGRFTNVDSLKLLRAIIKVKRQNGTEFECNTPMIDFKNQNFINIQKPNVQPPAIFDMLVSMYREFALPIQSCAPDGQPLGVGDSVEFLYEYTFRNNFAVPRAGGLPPALVNFRNAPWDMDYAWTLPDSVGLHRPLSQYSGYIFSRTFPKHTIRPCTTSLLQQPFQFGLRIARANMFPFEVREMAELCKFDYYLPTGVNLISTAANLTLQDTIKKFINQPVPWSNISGGVSLDFVDEIFKNPADEGFTIRTDFVFDPSCSFTGPDTSTLDAGICFHPLDIPYQSLLSLTRTDATGFLDALPRLKANFSQTILDLSSSNFSIDFILQNLRPAQATNAWMYVEPLNGTLTDVELLRTPSLDPVPGLANFFQLGNINVLENVPLRIKGANSNCDALQVRLIFGWDCEPVTSPFASTCGKDTVVLDLRLKNAVLELDIINQPLEVPLCEPSDYFVFEVSNANDGNAKFLTPSVKLPQGLSVVPGSAQVQYPSPGGAWVNIPNPELLAGNVFRWDIATFLPALTEGLPGFSSAPENTFRIRFRTIAECNFVANAQPVYGVEGVQPCGTFTNSLRKPDEPIGLEGVSPAYGVDISLSPASTDPIGCGQTLEINAQFLLQGSPASTDSIYLTLPAGVSFVAGSYSATQNAPSGQPQQFGQTLQLPFVSGLSNGSVVKFSFKIKYDASAGCVDKFVIAQTRQKTTGFCALINQSCGVYIATGEALLQIPTANPDLKLASFTPGNAGGGNFTFDATLENGGTVPATNPVLQVWVDQNGNGVPDGSDQLVQTINYTGTIAGGGTASESGNLNVTLADLCKLIAVLPGDENCACGPKYFPINNLIVDQGTYARCDVESVTIGIDSTGGNLYQWQPTGLLSCQGCASATFNPGPNVMNGDFFTFVLFETAGGCTLEHHFEIRFGQALGIDAPDQTICRGDTITIDASPGGTYQWSGPGVNPTAQSQMLSPSATTTYAVTVTLSAGCTGTDMITVNVLEPTNVDLGTVKTCPGIPVNIFGDPTVDAGKYCKTFPKANGCDSTVCITLQVVPVAGVSTMSVCEGDSVQVFPNQFETAAGEYCKNFINSAGCDSTHCVTLNVVPKVTITPVDSVIITEGGSVTLNGPAGFAQYEWSPATGLSCTDCQSPVATPQATTEYTLTVRTAAGCEGTIVYRVVVFPPCFEKINVPNAFTPNGDNVNDKFRLITPDEGGFEKAVRLQVYNRWGQKIYDSTENPTWDGTYKGSPAPVDVYIFILDVECNGETRRLEKREVTLLR